LNACAGLRVPSVAICACAGALAQSALAAASQIVLRRNLTIRPSSRANAMILHARATRRGPH
jgi:hypothetical protein